MKKFKLLALVGTMVISAMALAGCSKEVECSMCGETKDGDTYEIFGEEVDMCDDCYETFEELGEAFN